MALAYWRGAGREGWEARRSLDVEDRCGAEVETERGGRLCICVARGYCMSDLIDMGLVGWLVGWLRNKFTRKVYMGWVLDCGSEE